MLAEIKVHYIGDIHVQDKRYLVFLTHRLFYIFKKINFADGVSIENTGSLTVKLIHIYHNKPNFHKVGDTLSGFK